MVKYACKKCKIKFDNKPDCKAHVNKNTCKRELIAIDLFCGCGGMSKGLTDSGIKVIAGIDIWDKAIESYQKNFNHLALCKDLKEFKPQSLKGLLSHSTVDIIVGGPLHRN